MKRVVNAALTGLVLLGITAFSLQFVCSPGATSADVASASETLSSDFLAVDSPRSVSVSTKTDNEDPARLLSDWTYTRLGRFSRGH